MFLQFFFGTGKASQIWSSLGLSWSELVLVGIVKLFERPAQEMFAHEQKEPSIVKEAGELLKKYCEYTKMSIPIAYIMMKTRTSDFVEKIQLNDFLGMSYNTCHMPQSCPGASGEEPPQSLPTASSRPPTRGKTPLHERSSSYSSWPRSSLWSSWSYHVDTHDHQPHQDHHHDPNHYHDPQPH